MQPERLLRHRWSAAAGALAFGLAMLLPTPPCIATESPEALARRVAELTEEMERRQRELAQTRRALDQAREELEQATARNADAEPATPGPGADKNPPALPTPEDAEDAAAETTGTPEIRVGPLVLGGAVRTNYVIGSYSRTPPNDGPDRGGDSGNVELDTFRINLGLEDDAWIGAAEYRWYPDPGQSGPASYSFLHTGWLGYRFADDRRVEVGVNRVPFGPGPYGVSQSYLFDLHYYLGLADDMDLGVKFATRSDDWQIDLGYYLASEGNWAGRSVDSARYSFDPVRWREALDPDGNVVHDAPENGFEERHQINVRAIRSFDFADVATEAGISLQYGRLAGTRVDDGDHWAGSIHMVNRIDRFKLATQLTRYEYRIDDDNPWRTDRLIPMGAFDFPWFAASKATVAAASLSYDWDRPRIPWFDRVIPYAEYSHVHKEASGFNDSQMVALGVQWHRGRWLAYTDLVFSNGNWFVGNKADRGGRDDYSRFDGVGDWGANGNDKWNYRFNINLGYYF